MVRMDSKGNLIFAGLTSILMAIGYNCIHPYLIEGWTRFDFGVHLSILHIITSGFLVMGAIKGKYKLFVPWMISSVFFIYILILLAFECIRDLPDFGTIIIIVIAIAYGGYLCFALYGAQNAFDQLRKAEPPSYNYLHDKSNIINHI